MLRLLVVTAFSIVLMGCGTLVPVLTAVAPSIEAGLANKGVNVSLDFASLLGSVCLDPESALATKLKEAPAGESLLPVLVPLCDVEEVVE